MTQITYDEFIQHLLAGDCALHGELLPNNYIRYRNDYISGSSNSLFYYSSGCVVCYTTSDTGVFVDIHQVSDNMNFYETLAEFSKRMNEYTSDPVVKYKFLFAIVSQDEVKEYDNLVIKYHYSCISKKYPIDIHIKKISKDNVSEIVAMCEPYLENDTFFGKALARSFYEHSGDENNLIGYYNGVLVGVASYDYCDTAKLGILNNIYVIPEYRTRGVGGALVRAAMSEYPGKRWLYQADNGNTTSQKLALSLCFSPVGKAIMFKRI